jgi:transcription antitermination factor NusG
MSRSWYAGRARSRRERRLSDALRADGIDVFCPLVRTLTRNGHQVSAPLFPGYVLVRAETEQALIATIDHHADFTGLVRFGDTTPTVPDEVIREWRERADNMGATAGVSPAYRFGDWVEIRVGSTLQLAQVDQECRGGTRLTVLFEFMGRQLSMETPVENVGYVDRIKIEDTTKPRPRRTRGSRRWITGFGPRVGLAGAQV